MNLTDVIDLARKTGVRDVHAEAGKTVVIVNSLSLATGCLAVATGIVFYLLSGSNWILFPALIEGLLFALVMVLNAGGHYGIAGILMYLTQNVAAVYFGLRLGMTVEVQLLGVFLVSASLLVFKKRLIRICCIGITCLCLLLLEYNLYTGAFKPIPVDPQTRFLFRWLAIISVLFLNILVIYFYEKNANRLYREVEEKNHGLKLLVGELEHANLSKSIFVRETSHEIRTPMNAIFGISQLLMREVDARPELAPVAPLAAPLYGASYNVLEIINNVLELSRIEAGRLDALEKEPFTLKPWLEGVVAIYQYIARTKGVIIQLEISSNMPASLISDKVKLTQIVNNLLSNAIKFTRRDTTINMRVTAEAQLWVITVQDRGAGMSEEKVARIFEPFVSERNAFIQGTGLGLHIARRLTELLGGRITVTSALGKGSLFTACFPLETPVTPVVDVVRMDAVTGKFPSFNNAHVLMIEDDRLSQVITSGFLKGIGCVVSVADNGVEGLEAARRKKPDIILLDMHMPHMGGRETLREIRLDPLLAGIPVIAASGDAFKEVMEDTLRAGANEYLVKPIEFRTLYNLLAKYLHPEPVDG